MALPQIKNERELLALAMTLEQRAASRFRLMAAHMREQGRDDLACLFEGLAQEEDSHADKLRQLSGTADLDAETLTQDLASVLDAIPGAPDAEALRRASVYECLAEAVRNEEKTFVFFSYIAASAEGEALQTLAETLATEELEHAKVLRRVRRQAYHQMRRVARRWPNASAIGNLNDLRNAAIRGERAIAAGLGGLSQRAAELEQISESVNALLSTLEQNSREPADSMPGDDDEVAPHAVDEDRSISGRDCLRAALDDAHDAFEFYDAVASTASQEDVMLTAQALLTCALERIQVLRGLKT